MKKITLNEIKKHEPCKSGWKKLLKNVGKNKADDEPLSLLTILESNGFNDTLWCLRVLPWNMKTSMEMADLMVLFTKPIICLMKDDRSKNAVEVLEKFSRGKATLKELKIASADADDDDDDYTGIDAYVVAAVAAVATAAAAYDTYASTYASPAVYDTYASPAVYDTYASPAVYDTYAYTAAAAAYTATANTSAAYTAAAAAAYMTGIAARIEAKKNQVEFFSSWIKENEK